MKEGLNEIHSPYQQVIIFTPIHLYESMEKSSLGNEDWKQFLMQAYSVPSLFLYSMLRLSLSLRLSSRHFNIVFKTMFNTLKHGGPQMSRLF